ncbi:MAG: hypothetical protein OER21_10900 [Gemmatimonadota bacterium]|nr:hypothetical protein [Gemmatimonadota bacterium]
MPHLPLRVTPIRFSRVPPDVTEGIARRIAAWCAVRTAPLRRLRRPAELLLLVLAVLLAVAVVYALTSPINRRH